MKITVENKKGLKKEIKVFIDKKTISSHMDDKYEEVKKNVSLKGFRPGKVPREVLKRQFGQAIYGEVLDQVLKDKNIDCSSVNFLGLSLRNTWVDATVGLVPFITKSTLIIVVGQISSIIYKAQ